MKRFLTIVIVILVYQLGYSQDAKTTIQEFYTYKNEIGINFTNVLGNVLSLNPNNVSSPYGITYRRHFGNKSFRSGFNFRTGSKSTEDFSSGAIRRDLSELSLVFRAGLESHIVLTKRILFSYGFDVLTSYENEISEIFDFISSGSSFNSNDWLAGAGLGPMLRLEYKISDRIFISSESSLYGFYKKGKNNLTVNGVTQSENKKEYGVELLLPQSLFFNISF